MVTKSFLRGFAALQCGKALPYRRAPFELIREASPRGVEVSLLEFHHSQQKAEPLECGGKRSATPLWII
jgi:hypothetical protein